MRSSDFHVEFLDVLVDVNTTAAEMKCTMTREGTFNDIPPTGREVKVGVVATFLLKEEQIIVHREFHNPLEIRPSHRVVRWRHADDNRGNRWAVPCRQRHQIRSM